MFSYSVRTQRNTDQENSEYGHFSCSANFNEPVIEEKYQDDKSILVKKLRAHLRPKLHCQKDHAIGFQ